MLANGCYFLFFCRGFKLVGPMVIMIYRYKIENPYVSTFRKFLLRMLAQDLMRFGIIYFIFLMGFGQAYYIIFMSYDPADENPMETSMESILQVDIFFFIL